MKTIKFLSLASAALLLTACSSEEPINGGIDNGDAKSYVKISLKTGNGTRADDEETVKADESTVDKVVLGFYVGDNRVDVRELTNLDWNAGSDDIENTASQTVITSIAPGTAGVKVVALANVEKDAMPASLSTFATEKRDYKNGDYFVMSSSVCNDGTNFVYYTELKESDFVEEGADLTNVKGAEIYIERLAAKVNVAEDPAGFNADHTEFVDMATFEFVPDFWALSGQPTNVFTIKQTGFLTIQAATQAMSSTLMSALYPEGSYRSSWAVGSTDGIKSVTYNDIADTHKDLGKDDYAYENAYNVFTQINPEDLSTTNTFVVVVGHYDVKDAEGKQVDNLYLFGFTEKDGKSVAAVYTNTDDLIAAACKMANKENIAGLVIKPLTIGTAAIFNGDEQYIETTAIPQIRWYSNGAKGFYVKNIHHIYGESDYLYGVVRNHYYKMNLKGATGLATPIADPNEPLEPETPDAVKLLQTTINVLDWKTMPTQDVTW